MTELSASLLQVKSVDTYYGQIQVLRKVSILVNEGEIIAVIGANGAGKSTLIKTICGMLHPKQGEVIFRGQQITRFAPEKLVGMGIGVVPEGRQLFGSLTVMDNIMLGAYQRYHRRSIKDIERDCASMFELFPVLGDRQRQVSRSLSGGEQQMLAIARGLMAKPKLLLLDEPTMGLAPLLVKEVLQVLRKLQAEGTSILLVEQNARVALRIADRGYVMNVGKISLEGSATQLLCDENVQAVYLGKRPGSVAEGYII